jgi:hypothetical protein
MKIAVKIDLLKFTGARTFTASNGEEHIAIPVVSNGVFVGKKGYYCSLSLVENKDGTDEYKNDGFVAVDIGKDRREAGEKGPIIGNFRILASRIEPAPARSSAPAPAASVDSDDDIPF